MCVPHDNNNRLEKLLQPLVPLSTPGGEEEEVVAVAPLAGGSWGRGRRRLAKKGRNTSCNLAYQEIAYCVQYSVGKKSLQFVEHLKMAVASRCTDNG